MRIAVFFPHKEPKPHSETGSLNGQTFLHIARLHPEHDFFLITNRHPSDNEQIPGNLQLIHFPIQEKTLFSRLLTDRIRIPKLLKKIKPDVLVGLDGPRYLNSEAAQIYFSSQYLNPSSSFSPKGSRWLHQFYLRRALKKTARMILPTERVKEIWEQRYPFLKHKTSFIPILPDAVCKPIQEYEKENIKAVHANRCEYFLYSEKRLSTPELILLLKAFSVFKKRLKSNMKLLIAGSAIPIDKNPNQLLDTYRYRDDVLIPDLSFIENKAAVTAAAYGLLSVSENENTGLSVFEAFITEVPVIAAETTLQKESDAGALLCFKPGDPESLAQQMMLLFKDETLRSRLIGAGKDVLLRHQQLYATHDFLNTLLPPAGGE